ncbi:MAG: amino acid carrier protein [Puniceicoccales bacterium]|jgi:AGCS family alanine or glycine:cation symporter|nr:amino acid carrier protein [Puniceicoccales bacterium]
MVLEFLDNLLWSYIDFFLILCIGFYLTLKSKFFQFRTIVRPIKTFNALMNGTRQARGLVPIRLYFSSMGGSIGIGNVGACITAVSIGGPGGLFWMWVAVFIGMLVKYSEIFLGIKYRIHDKKHGYDGGAPHYLMRAFSKKWISIIFCLLMCIYGAEIYQFKVVEDVFVDTFGLNRYLAILVLLSGTIYVTLGGIRRLSIICTILMPFFLLTYTGVCLYTIYHSNVDFFALLTTICKSAFSGHAAVGGFAGSTVVMAVHHGMARAVYSGDIGIGYDAIIQAETRITDPCVQARTAVFSLFTDCAICTLTILLVLCTGQWCVGHNNAFDCVVTALMGHFPNAQLLMAIFFFLAGWTTVLGYLAVGMKSAKAISLEKGQFFYLIYAIGAFITFSFVAQGTALMVMSVSGGLLLCINLFGIFKLRNELKFC